MSLNSISVPLLGLTIGCATLFELACVAIGVHFGGLEGLALAWMIATLTEAAMLLLVDPVHRRTGGVHRRRVCP